MLNETDKKASYDVVVKIFVCLGLLSCCYLSVMFDIYSLSVCSLYRKKLC